MTILITNRAKKQITKLPEIVKLAVAAKIRALRASQENVQVLKVVGCADIYRVRIGKYRIIYQKNTDNIIIVAVQHRKDVYRLLENL